MDGGGLAVVSGSFHAVWRRAGTLVSSSDAGRAGSRADGLTPQSIVKRNRRDDHPGR
jgi:hypothetical protein